MVVALLALMVLLCRSTLLVACFVSSFLFQCLNKNIKITLITKYIGTDLNTHLNKFKIFQIFDEILWLNESDQKFKFIENTKSIFIDDSFSQRKEVQDLIGIPTFDPSMVESLIDDRY